MGGAGQAIDLLSPASFAYGQPHDQFDWLRANDPVHWHEERGGPGFWAVTTHQDVRAVGRDPATFSSEPTILIPDGSAADFGDHKMMLTMDPPAHGAHRRLVVPDFVPRAARRLEPRIREIASSIVDGVCERGSCDLVEDLAGLMPSYVIAEMLGIPHQDGVALYRLTEAIHASPDSQPAGAALAAIISMFNYARTVWAAKRTDPGDDLASRLVTASVGDRPVDEIDFNLFFLLLVDAGGDTTRNLVSAGLDALFARPEQLALLRRDLQVMPSAIEELLRFVSPVVYMRRTSTADTTLGTRHIRAGDKVVMFYGSANRDETVFDRPHELDLRRRPNDHVAFGGGGPHFCVGAHIARLEVASLLREILDRMPDIAPDGAPEWLPSNFISGLRRLRVRFTPTRPRAGSGSRAASRSA